MSTPPARLAVTLIAFLALVHPAPGQGLPMLPDPITTPRLMEYADTLQLSDQQRLGLAPYHDEYLQRFRTLRDRDIQAFQDELLTLAMTFMRDQFQVPPRADLEAIIRDGDKLLGKINAVDRTLFDQMQSVLTEEQLVRLPRVRTARELEIYRLIATEFGGELNPGARVDLAVLIRNLKLPPEAVDPMLDLRVGEYRTALLRKIRNLHDIIKHAAVTALDVIDELGLRGMTTEEKMQFFTDEENLVGLQATFDEASKPFQDAAADLSEFNLRTFRRFVELLEPDAARRLRDRFHQMAYGRVYNGPEPWQRRYTAALALEALNDDRRTQIELEEAGFLRQDDPLVDDLVDTLEESRTFRTAAMLDDDSMPGQDRIDTLRERRKSLNDRAIATLDALLGPELVAELDGGEPPPKDARVVIMNGIKRVIPAQATPADTAGDEQPVRTVREMVSPKDLAGPITVGDVSLMAAILVLDDDDRAVLDTLFDDYRARHEAVLDGPADPAAEDPAAAAQATLDEVEAGFFDDLALLLPEEQMPRLARARSLRDRARNATRLKVAGIYRRGGEHDVDLVRITYGADLTPNIITAIEPLLDPYGESAAGIQATRIDLAHRIRRRWDMIKAAREKGGPAASQMASSIREKERDLQRQMETAEAGLTALNQETFAAICERLPADAVWSFRARYNAAAHPEIYKASQRIETHLTGALALPDLGESQRDRILEIAGAFRERDLVLSDQALAETRARKIEERQGMPERSDIEREIDLERLRFERRELRARTVMRLRLALGPELVERVEGLGTDEKQFSYFGK